MSRSLTRKNIRTLLCLFLRLLSCLNIVDELSRQFIPAQRSVATFKLALLTDEYLHRTAIWYVGLINTTDGKFSPYNIDPDIVKVRLQTTSQYKSALDGATQIFKNEGPLAFYKVPRLNRNRPSNLY